MVPLRENPELVAQLARLEEDCKSLDWQSSEQVGEVFDVIGQWLRKWHAGLATAPAFKEPIATETVPLLATEPVGMCIAIQELSAHLAASGIDTANSRFLGYIPGGGLPAAALANFIASSLNRYVGMHGAAPSAAELENAALAWLIRKFGLPNGAWGTFCSGGSVATLTALAAARDLRPWKERPLLTCYLSEQSHFANRRALAILGISQENIRTVSTDAAFRMNARELERMVRSDIQNGCIPWVVIGTAGTTNTGAIDPLAELARICRQQKMWFHVDAAYGGMFVLVPSLLSRFKGLEEADSLVVDPHKGMFLPYGCGAVLVANGEHLRRAMAGGGAYLADIESAARPSANDYSVELTRPCRGAQLWTVLRAHGEEVIAKALEEKLILAKCFYQALSVDLRFEVLPESDLTVVAFRLKGDDQKTAELLAKLTASGRYLLSSTRIESQLFLRCCILSFRTHWQDLDGLLAMLQALAPA